MTHDERLRQPTPDDVLYDWHARAMRGENPPVHEVEPHCGWFVRSYSYMGAFYPGLIFMHQPIDEQTGELVGDEVLRCVVARPGDGWPAVAGHEADPFEEWPHLAKRPISKEEYHALIALLMFSDRYVGPTRPFVRWMDEREQAADMLRYSMVMA